MKAFIAFVVLALVMAGSAVGLHLRRDSRAAAVQAAHQAALVEKLSQQLESLGERLASVERAAQEAPDRPAASSLALTAAAPAAGEEGAEHPASAKQPTSAEDRDARAQAFTRHLVASLGKDGERQFRDYIGTVYSEARTARKEQEQAEAEERQREYEALGEGPYGQHNRRVNTLGKQLGMDDRQKQRYHDLLASYQGRLGEIRKTVDWKDKAARQGFRDTATALQSEFDAHVAHLLNQQQAEDYAAMGAGEKSLGGGEEGKLIFRMDNGAVVTEEVRGVHDALMGEVRTERLRVFGGAGAVHGVEVNAEPPPPQKQEQPRPVPAGGD